jgi:hypothetical protein
VTGIAAGLTVMGLGLLVLPRRRAKAKRQLHEQMQALRDGLEGASGRQLDEEIQRAASGSRRAIAPYTRFVRAELERLDALADELNAVRARLAACAPRPRCDAPRPTRARRGAPAPATLRW